MAEFTRQQFYEQVWRKSAVQLAKELDISDVAIGQDLQEVQYPPTVARLLGQDPAWSRGHETEASEAR